MDSNYLKDLIYNKKHDEAYEYLVNSIEDLICNYIPTHKRNTFLSISDVPQNVAGSLMTYQLLQDGPKTMPPELAVMKLMSCYSNMKKSFEGK